ncbi:MAG: hypothetical protein KAS26_02290 [Sulfurimonas sp.]|nr:hypothetical protein [Sulfurimonas sp.]
MKIKSFITLSLLFALSFSMTHEYVFASYHNGHCESVEYADISETQNLHVDICETHFECQQASLLPQNMLLPQGNNLSSKTISNKEIYQFSASLNFLKPPIA